MNAIAAIVIASTLLAAVYGVVFSYFYPLVEMTAGLLTMFALFGLMTSVAVAGIWRMKRKSKSHDA
ncbi:membrane protein DedA with SNARE-associated domain [Bradyrhizobium barranii subsp. barranii]